VVVLLDASHHAQRTGRCIGIKHNPGLLQNPRLYLFMVNAQQVERSYGVVLFSRGARLVPHQLCHHACGYFKPLGQALE